MTIENDPSEVVQANAELLTTPSLKMVSGPMLA
jgi:hypothetical protein